MANELKGLLGLGSEGFESKPSGTRATKFPAKIRNEWRHDDDGRLIRRREYRKIRFTAWLAD